MAETKPKNSSTVLVIMAVIFIAVLILLAVIGYMILNFNLVPKTGTFTPTPTSTTITIYDYEKIAEDYFNDNKDIDLCSSLYPEINTQSYDKHLLYWNETVNPTVIMVTIYPEVNVSKPEGRVMFTASSESVQKWIPTDNGRQTVTIDATDPSYNPILTAALNKTGGNRGFMASWEVTLINGDPNNYSASGNCSPIPYER